MENEASIVRLDRKSSIENEPRTLTFDQIQFAREAALYVVNTRSIEEAMSIFTEGLEPVVSRIKQNGDAMMSELSEEMGGYLRQQIRLPAGLRDIATAPF